MPHHERSRDSGDSGNPGNNLYVTGLSLRVASSDLEKYFSHEGKVLECHIVMDPHTRESRGFGFVTMETVEDADRCIKYLNRSVFEGRLITVEKHEPPPSRHELCIDISKSPIQIRLFYWRIVCAVFRFSVYNIIRMEMVSRSILRVLAIEENHVVRNDMKDIITIGVTSHVWEVQEMVVVVVVVFKDMYDGNDLVKSLAY
ncbi:hypothetical protein QJS04_geneDACA002067 [Acorus gramineus]|uniref:RRM domain-containing protein n=1 Tax=Acorus gramineus TaxID=55184 RepID=A0AAV9A832_ACOGR|nr:hypothetical protein QJS04_geneDACA002067 [Acorus gramineus]